MKIRIMHAYYGCETGCTGHIVETEDGKQIGCFEFGHPCGRDPRKWAKEFLESKFGKDHCYDLDYENSVIIDD